MKPMYQKDISDRITILQSLAGTLLKSPADKQEIANLKKCEGCMFVRHAPVCSKSCPYY